MTCSSIYMKVDQEKSGKKETVIPVLSVKS